MRMRADAPVLWRAQGESQIGAEPGRSLLLRGLSPGEQELLDHLPRRLGDASLLRAARRCSVNVERARALLGELRDQGALRSEESRPSKSSNAPSQTPAPGWPNGGQPTAPPTRRGPRTPTPNSSTAPDPLANDTPPHCHSAST